MRKRKGAREKEREREEEREVERRGRENIGEEGIGAAKVKTDNVPMDIQRYRGGEDPEY